MSYLARLKAADRLFASTGIDAAAADSGFHGLGRVQAGRVAGDEGGTQESSVGRPLRIDAAQHSACLEPVGSAGMATSATVKTAKSSFDGFGSSPDWQNSEIERAKDPGRCRDW